MACACLAASAGCPAETVPAEHLAFACQVDRDCLPGLLCLQARCSAPLDAGVLDVPPGDRASQDQHAADRVGLDGAGADRADADRDDTASLDRAAEDSTIDDTTRLDSAIEDSASPADVALADLPLPEMGLDAAPQDAASELDAAAADAGPPTAQPVAVDLVTGLGASATFSSVFPFVDDQGQAVLVFGPGADGNQALRTRLDGSDPQRVAFRFTQDTAGSNTHGNTCRNANAACQPLYPSIGHRSCATNTEACGPDNENGRGLFASGFAKGEHWLVLTGARPAGDLDYVYMTPDANLSPTFRHVDLSDVLGGQTKGVSALHIFADDLYLGFPDTGGAKPYLIKMTSTPAESGLDAVEGSHAFNLHAEDMPELGGVQSIDQIWSLHDRLYVANRGGCRRSAEATTTICSTSCATQWPSCTPNAVEYTAKVSAATTEVSELLPRDRTWVGPAIIDGRVYLGRNTTLGPQLWMCDPGRSGVALDCEPADWSLVAANSSGDLGLCQFNNPDSDRISMVAAAGRTLYLGFDNAVHGIVLFRSTLPLPSQRHHLVGEGGCGAELHPASCAGIGGNGLGAPATTTRILDAVAVGDGATAAVLLVVGNASNLPRVVRLR